MRSRAVPLHDESTIHEWSGTEFVPFQAITTTRPSSSRTGPSTVDTSSAWRKVSTFRTSRAPTVPR